VPAGYSLRAIKRANGIANNQGRKDRTYPYQEIAAIAGNELAHCG
jgi:hypothetical protein